MSGKDVAGVHHCQIRGGQASTLVHTHIENSFEFNTWPWSKYISNQIPKLSSLLVRGTTCGPEWYLEIAGLIEGILQNPPEHPIEPIAGGRPPVPIIDDGRALHNFRSTSGQGHLVPVPNRFGLICAMVHFQHHQPDRPERGGKPDRQ